jgi:hypothetical protein
MKAISANMMSALEDAHAQKLASWDYGAGTLGSLKKRGWVKEVGVTTRGRVYGTTPEGEVARNELFQGPYTSTVR